MVSSRVIEENEMSRLSYRSVIRPASAAPARLLDGLGSVLPFGLCDSLFNFSAAVRAFVGEVDLRHAPMGFNISNVHSQRSSAGGADNCSYFGFVVLDVGGHVGSPSVRKHAKSSLDLTYGVWRTLIVNSCERTKNGCTIFVCVAKFTHGLT